MEQRKSKHGCISDNRFSAVISVSVPVSHPALVVTELFQERKPTSAKSLLPFHRAKMFVGLENYVAWY